MAWINIVLARSRTVRICHSAIPFWWWALTLQYSLCWSGTSQEERQAVELKIPLSALYLWMGTLARAASFSKARFAIRASMGPMEKWHVKWMKQLAWSQNKVAAWYLQFVGVPRAVRTRPGVLLSIWSTDMQSAGFRCSASNGVPGLGSGVRCAFPYWQEAHICLGHVAKCFGKNPARARALMLSKPKCPRRKWAQSNCCWTDDKLSSYAAWA